MMIDIKSGTYQGLWRIISAKDTQAYGKAIDLAFPDGLKLERGNAPLAKLQASGFEIVGGNLSGISASGTVYGTKRVRKPKAKPSE